MFVEFEGKEIMRNRVNVGRTWGKSYHEKRKLEGKGRDHDR